MTDVSFWFAVIAMVGCVVMFFVSLLVIKGAGTGTTESFGWLLGFLGFCFFGMNLGTML